MKRKNFFRDRQSSEQYGDMWRPASQVDSPNLCGCPFDQTEEIGTLATAMHWLLTGRPCCSKACHEILLRSVQVVTKT